LELTVIPHINVDYVNLYCLGDLHFGSEDCDEEYLEKVLREIERDKQARVILNGDLLQMDIESSVGSTYKQRYTPSEQRRGLRRKLAPISDKILAMQGGNHDEGRSKEDDSSVMDMADFLGVRYTRKEMLLKIPVGQKRNGKPAVYTLYAAHGWGGGRTMGAVANKLIQLKNIVLADLYVISHTHKPLFFPKALYVPDLHNNNVRMVKMGLMNTGSFQMRGDYPVSKGMEPTILENPMVTLQGREKKIEVKYELS